MPVAHVVANPAHIDALIQDTYGPKGWELLEVQRHTEFRSVVMVIGRVSDPAEGGA